MIQIIDSTSMSAFKQLVSECIMLQIVYPRAKAKKLHIYLFAYDVTWVETPKDVAAQRWWTALIWREKKDKTGKNVNMLNPTRNSRLCSRHFDEEKISTEGYMSADPVCFSWNNWRKPQRQTRKEEICNFLDECEGVRLPPYMSCSALLE